MRSEHVSPQPSPTPPTRPSPARGTRCRGSTPRRSPSPSISGSGNDDPRGEQRPERELQPSRLAEHGDEFGALRTAQYLTHGQPGQGQRQEAEKRARALDSDDQQAPAPHHRATDVEHPGARVTQTYGQRALAGDAVTGDVSQVVDDEERDGEQPDGNG